MDPSSSSRLPAFPVSLNLAMTGWMPKFDLLSKFLRFLALPRPDVTLATSPRGPTNTTTLAAQNFDIDDRTGFMPPKPPLARLSSEWETWEATLDSALTKRLKLYNGPTTTGDDRNESAAWREGVREVGRIPPPLQWYRSMTV